MYSHFQKKKKALKAKMEEPHIRTGKMLQAKTVCTHRLHYSGAVI
jgi:hypothetical protein